MRREAGGVQQGARGMEQGAWSRGHGAGGMEQEAWSRKHGAGSMEQGAKGMEERRAESGENRLRAYVSF